MPAPVSVTGTPRTRPCVGCIEIARTTLSPRCWATSSVRVLARPFSVTSTVRALFRSGTWSRGNSTSTTGPRTRTTRPVPVAVLVAVAVMSLTSCGRERLDTADDLADFLGNLRLAGLVGLAAERADQLVRIVRRRLHSRAACRVFRCRRIQQTGVQAGLDVLREPGLEQGLRVRLELVRGARGLRRLPRGLQLRRSQPPDRGPLGQHRDELGVHQVQFVNAQRAVGAAVVEIVVGTGEEGLDQGLANLGRVGVLGVVAEPGPAPLELALPEPVVRLALAADDVQHRFLALFAQQCLQLLSGADHVGVVATAETAVAGDHQHGGALGVAALGQQRVVQGADVGQLAQRPGDLVGVRPRSLHPGLRLHDARGSDELLRLGDLPGRFDRPDTVSQFPKLSHYLPGHFFGAGRLTFTVSWPTSSAAIASTFSSPGTTEEPSEAVNCFLNSSTADTIDFSASSDNLPVSTMSLSNVPLVRRR